MTHIEECYQGHKGQTDEYLYDNQQKATSQFLFDKHKLKPSHKILTSFPGFVARAARKASMLSGPSPYNTIF